MSDRDDLAELMATTFDVLVDAPGWSMYLEAADAIIAAGWEKPTCYESNCRHVICPVHGGKHIHEMRACALTLDDLAAGTQTFLCDCGKREDR